MKMKKNGFLIVIPTVLFTVMSMSVAQIGGDWKAPPEADKITNPLKGDAASVDAGKKTFQQMCAICHGNKGKGDGVAGAALNPRPTDFSKSTFQEQTDGAIFWKMTEGRAPMAAYKDILKEDQRWELVNYIRTLKK